MCLTETSRPWPRHRSEPTGLEHLPGAVGCHSPHSAIGLESNFALGLLAMFLPGREDDGSVVTVSSSPAVAAPTFWREARFWVTDELSQPDFEQCYIIPRK